MRTLISVILLTLVCWIREHEPGYPLAYVLLDNGPQRCHRCGRKFMKHGRAWSHAWWNRVEYK